MKHTHHIVPKHMGGTDDPSNLIELTIEEHAEAHRILYEQHGRWQDKVAWQGLLGLIPHQQVMQEMYNARKGKGNIMYGKPCYYKMTEEEKQRWKDNIGKGNKNKIVSEETRNKLSKSNIGKNAGKEPWNKGKSCPASLDSKIKKGKPVIYKGITYYGITEAARANNTSVWYILKEVRGLEVPSRNCKHSPK